MLNRLAFNGARAFGPVRTNNYGLPHNAKITLRNGARIIEKTWPADN
jgi:hypothetical protein